MHAGFGDPNFAHVTSCAWQTPLLKQWLSGAPSCYSVLLEPCNPAHVVDVQEIQGGGRVMGAPSGVLHSWHPSGALCADYHRRSIPESPSSAHVQAG
jgi:hypothetical protein